MERPQALVTLTPPLENRRWEIFCKEYAHHRNGSKAAREAKLGGKAPAPTAARLLKKPVIRERIAEIELEIKGVIADTRKKLIKEFWDMYQEARHGKDLSNARFMLVEIGRLEGLYVERKEEMQKTVTLTIGDPNTEVKKHDKKTREQVVRDKPQDGEVVRLLPDPETGGGETSPDSDVQKEEIGPIAQKEVKTYSQKDGGD